MANTPTRKLAVLLHADVVGSTALVQRNESVAHDRMQDTFRRFGSVIESYGGNAHEIRGDALVAEFARASDAMCAAVAFQCANATHNEGLVDDIRPQLRVGISLGEVVIADGTVTGPGVVLAQRLEQLAEPGGVVAQTSVVQTVPGRMPFEYEDLGPQELKGFTQSVWASEVRLATNERVPEPEGGSPDAELSDGAESKADPTLDLPDEPSIAVLPFDNMSGDPEQEYFSDGIAEDITTALSRDQVLFVAARNSAFTYRGSAVDIRRVGRELGVRYCLEGSVRKAGNQVRITAQLIDTTDGIHLWAERYDRTLEDVFAVQDEITEAVAMAVGRRINLSESDRAVREQRADSGVWELILRIQWHMDRFNVENLGKALTLATEATEKYPDDSGAHSMLAYVNIMDSLFGYGGGSATEAAMAAAASAKHAIVLDPNNSYARGYLAVVLWMGGDHEGALAEATVAYHLNPGNAMTLSVLGIVNVFKGPEGYAVAVECLERAIRVSPQDPMLQFWYMHRGYAEFFNRNFEAAIAWMTRSSERNPDLPTPYRVQAASWVHLGDIERAQTAWKKNLEVNPNLDMDHYLPMVRNMLKRQEDFDLLLEGYKRIGVHLGSFG